MIKPKSNLTAGYVRELLEYNPKTGIFRWKFRSNKSWNTRYAGSIAGTLYKGYVSISIGDTKYAAHRLAWLIMTGMWPTVEIDHKDLNKANNRFKNLREATESQNRHNRKLPKHNTSGYKCVWWHKQNKRWQAGIYLNKKLISLGLFNTPEAAYAAYCKQAKTLLGEFWNS